MSDVNESPRRRRRTKLQKKIDTFLKAKEQGRRMYAMADRILDEVSAELKPGTEVQLYDTKGEPWQKYQLVDLFADKKIVWKPCGVRRYDLVPVK